MTNAVVFSLDEVEHYDAIVDAMQDSEKAELRSPSGDWLEVPTELLSVVIEAAKLLARGKAVSVTSHSRHRFI